MKSIYLSRHATRRMRLYDIHLRHVTKTLQEPDEVVPSMKNRYNAYEKVGGRVLRVTYVEEEQRYIVISVTPRKRFYGSGRCL